MTYEDIKSWDDEKLRKKLEINNRKLQVYRALLRNADTTAEEEEYKREIAKIKALINIMNIEQGRRFLSKNWDKTIASKNNSFSSNKEDDI